MLAILLAAPALGTAATRPLSVVTTLHPLALIVSEIGGERVRVETLVPPGASPHAFEPAPGDVARIARARAFVRVGAVDDWAARLAAAAPRGLTVLVLLEVPGIEPLLAPGAAARGGTPADAQAAGPDPHVWLDPIRVRDAVLPALEALLTRLDPAGAELYQTRRAAFAARLGDLDAEIRSILAQAPGRRFVPFHRAWTYFAARYGLEELGAVEEFAGEEPTPRELAALVEAARRAGIPAVMIEPQLDDRVAKAIGAEFGARTVVVDPLGDSSDPARASYLELMRYNARAFRAALGGDRR